MSPRLAAVFAACLLTAAARSAAAPLHPTALLVEYKGKSYPVVAVVKDDPVILVDGQRKRLTSTASFQTERVERYRGPTATMGQLKVSGVDLFAVTNVTETSAESVSPGGKVAGFVEFETKITASQPLKDCYLVVVAFDRDFQTSRKPHAQIRVHQIPDLEPDRPTVVKFSSSSFTRGREVRFIAQLFSGEDEVRTNASRDATAYYQRREQVIHQTAVEAWLAQNPHASQAARPVLQVPPLLDSTAGLPVGGSATLILSREGTVASVELTGDFPAAARETLIDAFSAWLFLPKLKEGQPQESRVVLPLQF